MWIIFIVIVVVVAFWLWSKKSAGNTRHQFVNLLSKTMADRNQYLVRFPTWHEDRRMSGVLDASLKPLTTTTPPHRPEVLSEWLGASNTREDIATFLYHAEASGLSQSDQIAMAYDFTKALIDLDIIGDDTRADRIIAMHIATAIKLDHGQTIYDIPSVTPAEAESYFRRLGATEVTDGFPYLEMDIWFRNKKHGAQMYPNGYGEEGLPNLCVHANWN